MTLMGDWINGETVLSTRSDLYLARTATSFALLNTIDHPDVTRVYPHEIFCDGTVAGKCVANDSQSVFYHDDDHPSSAGVQLINKANRFNYRGLAGR